MEKTLTEMGGCQHGAELFKHFLRPREISFALNMLMVCRSVWGKHKAECSYKFRIDG